MSAPAQAPPRPRAVRTAATLPLTWGRLLRIELRHNAVPWVLPLIAGLFWFDSYRPSTATPLMWVWRTFWNMGQGHTIIDFGPFIAGVAAWMAARDGRRGTADLVTATARPRWVAQLANWAATAIWSVGAYLVFVGVMFGVYLGQGVQGQPPWWWVAVGAVAVAAFSAAGFAAGVLYPSRFAAPLAAFGGFLVCMLSSQTGFTHTTGWALLLPTNSNGNFQGDSGMLYPWLPDLSIARIILLAAITAIALGLIGLRGWDGARRLRLGAAALTVAGVVGVGSAVGLAESAKLGPHGMVIPALHDAANDQSIAYRPDCAHAAGRPVCVNPAYKADLVVAAAALAPVFREVAGLAGAPVRATQIGATYGPTEGQAGQAMTIGGQPPVLHMPLGSLGLEGAFGWTGSEVSGEIRLLSVHAFIGAGTGAGPPAQQALQAAMLAVAGVPFDDQPSLLGTAGLPGWAPSVPGGRGPAPTAGPVYAAARRLAALPAGARHAWLATHLAALRAGQLTLGELP